MVERLSALQAALAGGRPPRPAARAAAGARAARRRPARPRARAGPGDPAAARRRAVDAGRRRGAARPGADAGHAGGRRGGVRRGIPRRLRHRAGARPPSCSPSSTGGSSSLRRRRVRRHRRPAAPHVRRLRAGRAPPARRAARQRPRSPGRRRWATTSTPAGRQPGWRRCGRCSASAATASDAAVVDRARVSEQERMRRWRLVLGGGRGRRHRRRPARRRPPHRRRARRAVRRRPRRGAGAAGGPAGWSRSAPSVARWLGDIRRYFPTPVVQVLQRDAVERLDLHQLLLEPELLDELEPDLHLVTLLVELNRLLPDETRATARQVVAKVVEQLERRLADRTRQAVQRRAGPRQPHRPAPAGRHRLGAHDPRQPAPLAARAAHASCPSGSSATAADQRSLARDVVIVAIDQSGSMADSVVYASLFACVLGPDPGAAHVDGRVRHRRRRPHRRCSPTPSTCCSACSSAAAPTSRGALGYCRRLITPARATPCSCSSATCSRAATRRAAARRVAELVRAGVTRASCCWPSATRARRRTTTTRPTALAALGAPSWRCTPDEFPMCWPPRSERPTSERAVGQRHGSAAVPSCAVGPCRSEATVAAWSGT